MTGGQLRFCLHSALFYSVYIIQIDRFDMDIISAARYIKKADAFGWTEVVVNRCIFDFLQADCRNTLTDF